MVEGEQEGIRWKAGEDSVQEGGKEGHPPPWKPHSPGLGLLWALLARVTSDPLRSQGSSPHSSWMTIRGREAESPVRQDKQVRGQPQLTTTKCPTDGRSWLRASEMASSVQLRKPEGPTTGWGSQEQLNGACAEKRVSSAKGAQAQTCQSQTDMLSQWVWGCSEATRR